MLAQALPRKQTDRDFGLVQPTAVFALSLKLATPNKVVQPIWLYRLFEFTSTETRVLQQATWLGWLRTQPWSASSLSD
jgi:hypothetical protein